MFRRSRRQVAPILILSVGSGLCVASGALLDAIRYRPPGAVGDAQGLRIVPRVGDYSAYRRLADTTLALDLAAYRRTPASGQWTPSEPPVTISLECVSENYYRVLRPGIALGHAPAPGEATGAMLLSHATWSRAFGQSPDIVGHAVSLAGKRYSVVAVLSPEFEGLLAESPDAQIMLDDGDGICIHGSVDSAGVTAFGRLRAGFSVGAADVEVGRLLGSDGDGQRPTGGARTLSIAEGRGQRLSWDGAIVNWTTLAGFVLFVVACASAAMFQGLEATARREEFRIRRQLGAASWQQARLVLREQTAPLLATVVATVAVAAIALQVFARNLPLSAAGVVLNGRTLAMAVGLAFVGTVAALLPPLLLAVRVRSSVRSGVQTQSASLRYAPSALIALQAALSLALAVVALLTMKSAANLTTDPGFDLDHLLVATLDFGGEGYVPDQLAGAAFRGLAERARTLPGVASVAVGSGDLLGALRDRVMMAVHGSAGTRTAAMTTVQAVSPGYFETVGTRIVAGRGVTDSDTTSSARVAVVDESLAGSVWPGTQAMGQCVYLLGRPADCWRVVGISQTRRSAFLADRIPELYLPFEQAGSSGLSIARPRAVFIRALDDASAVEPTVSSALGGVAVPGRPGVRSMKALASAQTRSWRLAASLFGLSGIGTTGLAIAGLFAVLSTAVRRRQRELSLRLALGSSRAHLIWLVVGRNLGFVAVGIASGVVLVAWAVPSLRWLLVGVTPLEPSVLATVTGALAAVAIGGAWIPARRAASLDPAVGLRED